MTRTLLPLLAIALFIPLAACDDASKSADAKAAPKAASAVPAGSKEKKADAKPAADGKAEAKPAAEKPADNVSANPLTDLPKLAEGFVAVKLDQFVTGSGPKGTKYAAPGADRKGPKVVRAGEPADPNEGWGTLTVGEQTISVKMFNGAGNSYAACPKIEDVKAKTVGAKVIIDKAWDGEFADEKSTGSGNHLYMFEKGDKTGFYALTQFDHGDDATEVCCAPGAIGEALNFVPSLARADAEQLAAVCQSFVEKF